MLALGPILLDMCAKKQKAQVGEPIVSNYKGHAIRVTLMDTSEGCDWECLIDNVLKESHTGRRNSDKELALAEALYAGRLRINAMD
jgi:hypothetical protein